MMGKDSPEVVRFMARFARLKSFVDDDPSNLVKDAIRDESIRDLCTDLFWDVFLLESAEREHPELFTAPVDPSFIAAWRDYQKLYAAEVGWISGTILLGSLGGEDDDIGTELARRRLLRLTPEDLWGSANHDAVEAVDKMKMAIEFAGDQIEQDDRWDDDQQDWVQDISDGVAALSSLRRRTGLDLRGMLRRRALVPFVLVPRKVANQDGSEMRSALLQNLKEAQDAFVHGTPVACVVLLRATVEVALKEHYRSFGTTLKGRIESVRGRLPLGATVRELHELRELANALLHDPSTRLRTGVGPSDAETETNVAAMLVVVRALIEGIK